MHHTSLPGQFAKIGLVITKTCPLSSNASRRNQSEWPVSTTSLNVTQDSNLVISFLKKTSPPLKAKIVKMLGGRDDRYAVAAVVRELRSREPEVRAAAIGAAAQLGGDEAIGGLISVLKSGDEDDVEIAKSAVMYMEDVSVLDAVAGQMQDLSVPAKAA